MYTYYVPVYCVYVQCRPVPITRKRRFSGRQCRPSHSVSEGDMAMADEMGEGEGEGGDDGFVDCAGGEAVKRRNKKRGGLEKREGGRERGKEGEEGEREGEGGRGRESRGKEREEGRQRVKEVDGGRERGEREREGERESKREGRERGGEVREGMDVHVHVYIRRNRGRNGGI